MAELGFSGFFEGPYGVLAPDALEALRTFGSDEHAGILERAMASRRLWFPARRRRALDRASAAFNALQDRSPLIEQRARYIEREAPAFSGLGGPGP